MLVGLAVPHSKEHPWERVAEGISAAGDTVSHSPESWEAVITWNMFGIRGRHAKRVKANGGIHVCMENGHLKRKEKTCIVARDGFNGTGWTPFCNMYPHRWERFGLSIEPWRKDGNHVLVVGQMGGSYSEMAMNDAWPTDVINELKTRTDRPIWYLPHRRRQKYPSAEVSKTVKILEPTTHLKKALEGAHACVVWTSSAVTEALRLGVPGFYCGPSVALSQACRKGVKELEFPYKSPFRDQMFFDFAWQNWWPHEISRGLPWQLLRDA